MVALNVPAGSVGARQGITFFRQHENRSRIARSTKPPRSKRSLISSGETPIRLGRGMEDRHDADLLAHLGKLLRDEVPLEDFRHWFSSALWEWEWADDDVTLDFAYLVENRLAEFSGGHLSERQLLRALREDVAAPLQTSPVGSSVSRSPV